MVSSTVVVVFLASYVSYALAVTVLPRAFLGCSLLIDQIHCFGGYTGTVSDKTTFYTNRSVEHLTLDLTTLDYSNTSNAREYWVVLPQFANLLPTGFLASTSIAQQTKFLIYGGDGPQSPLPYPITVFDTASSIWSTLPTFGNYSRFSPVVDIGASNQLWTWGGLINDTYISNGNGNMLNYVTQRWTPIGKIPTTSLIRIQHTATLVPSKHTIYIIGGISREDLLTTPGNGADMLDILTFDTVQSSWSSTRASTSNGQNIIPRTRHTTSIIPNTTSFFIFGGASADTKNTTILNDYVYLYDYESSIYTPIQFKDGSGPGARTGHEAVSYKSYVMIMFGINSQHELLDDFFVLNATNISSLYWIGDPMPTGNPIIAPNNAKEPILSGGAIAGIAVGTAIAGIGLTTILGYFIYKKRKQRKEFELETSDPRQTIAHEKNRGTGVPYTETTAVDYQSVSTNKEDWPTLLSPSVPYDSPLISSTVTKPFQGDTSNHTGKPDVLD